MHTAADRRRALVVSAFVVIGAVDLFVNALARRVVAKVVCARVVVIALLLDDDAATRSHARRCVA